MAASHSVMFTFAICLLCGFINADKNVTNDNSEVLDLLNGNFTASNVSNLEDIDWSEEAVENFLNTFNGSQQAGGVVKKDADISELFSSNNTFVLGGNETFGPGENITWISPSEDGNETALPSVMDPGSEHGESPTFGTTESAVILAGVFVLLAVVAFGGMFAWRRYLLVRYGNSDMLITDDAYDITDLRNFEI